MANSSPSISISPLSYILSSATSRILTTIISTLLFSQLVSAHFQILYPPWRGNTLVGDMQWEYPCGGLTPTTNRTKWPITGGPISVMPGWNAGHPTAFFYINMGFGNNPVNHSNIMHGVFQITGPSRDAYPGEFCLPFVPLPANATQLGVAAVGLNATIQVIQVALHGASLYNCADIIFVKPGEEDKIADHGGCFNSTTIGFNQVFATRGKTSAAVRVADSLGSRMSLVMAVAFAAAAMGFLSI